MFVTVPDVVNNSVIANPDAIKIGFTGNFESARWTRIVCQRLDVWLKTLLEEFTELSKLPFSER
jgi:hypothetical protein